MHSKINPYEVPQGGATSGQLVSVAGILFCVIFTAALTIVAAVAYSMYVNAILKPTLQTWVIPYGIMIFFASFPAGISSVLVAVLIDRFFGPKGLYLALGVAVCFTCLPITVVPMLKGLKSSIYVEYLTSLLLTVGSPLFCGTALYLYKLSQRRRASLQVQKNSN